MKKITIQEIAQELHLSRNTVAKALNNSDAVSYETKFLVIEKAYEMGYTKLSPSVVNEFKLKNRMETPKTVVVLVRREISLFWNRIIMGVSDELNKYGSKLQLSFVNEENERELNMPVELSEDVDGIVVLSVFSKEYMDKVLKYDIPMVLLDTALDSDSSSRYGDVLLCEGFYSVKRMTEDLIARGIRDIGFIGDTSYCRTNKDRFDGYCAALEEAELCRDSSIVVNHKAQKKYCSREEVEEALDLFSHVPEAVVCVCDDTAFEVIRVLRRRGYRVPEDVAVTGFDDVEGMSQAETFVTTARGGNQRIGRRLVQKLFWRMQNPEFAHEITMVGVEILIRKSSERPCLSEEGKSNVL